MAKRLATYRSKRDFTKTPEPVGDASTSHARYPRFVIQKHEATRLHYDLRLEVDGVFKSWAVTKGPSLDPRDKRLAVEVEDHPLDYGDFEGTIPKGQYGGGTVMLWDRGFWAPEGETTVEQALAKGELKFVLAGEKLKGGWVLVRLRKDREKGRGAERSNWLLIKHHDEFERDGAEGLPDDDKSVASGRSMNEITAGEGPGPKPFMGHGGGRADPGAVWQSKSLAGSHLAEPESRKKAGKQSSRSIDRSTSAGVCVPPEFIPPQLCETVARPPSGARWVHEIKLDGYRMQLRVESSSARMRTRKGLDWTERFASIAEAARDLPDCIIDGEVVALDANGAPDFAGLQAELATGRSSNLIYFAFDLLFADGENLQEQPLDERKRRLEKLLANLPHPEGGLAPIRYLPHLVEPGDAVLKSACKLELEGIVSKTIDAPYRSGRGRTWTKAKCRGGQEVVIGGWSGSSTDLRSLIVGVYRDGKLIHSGRVGTGFSQAAARDLLRKLRPLASDTSPFTGPGAPRRAADVRWVEPRLVAEIQFAGWTPDGMVRQASFKGLREDKPAVEITEEKPATQHADEAANQGPHSGKSSGGVNVVMGVVVSNPVKPLWPATEGADAITKIELARYLEGVADTMLEHIRGRPCSILRAPDGIEAEQFFQRHGMPGMSSLVTLTKVSGDRKPYVQIDRPEALIALAQMAAVEFHPWNCAPGQPDVPGRLVFDLDPGPDVAFAEIATAAREMHERLQALGLEAFCKTTGGKGLHVVTPLDVGAKGRTDWHQAKTFAQAVCAQMAADSPDRYLTKMTKAIRGGRIFLDYLRNDRTATAVAPLSPRARPGGTVSMPVEWKAVTAKLNPKQFTVRTAPILMRRSKAWTAYASAGRPLPSAIEKLVKRATRLR